jgi:hypothetical protein
MMGSWDHVTASTAHKVFRNAHPITATAMQTMIKVNRIYAFRESAMPWIANKAEANRTDMRVILAGAAFMWRMTHLLRTVKVPVVSASARMYAIAERSG